MERSNDRTPWLRLAAAALSLLVACSGDGQGDDNPIDPNNPDDRQHQESGESWTFMVYMAADNDLEPFALDDLVEMMQVGSGDGFQLVVQADRAAMHSMAGVGDLPDWVSAKRLRVNPGGLEELADLGEPNMGDPAELSDFIDWAAGEFPADRYALIFWNHGAGWPGFGGDESTPSHDMLDLIELQAGISDGMTQAGLDQFALIGFDACLMATYEVAMTLRPFAEYLLASEELEPGHGWNYERLAAVRNDPSLGPIDMAMEIMEGFEDQARAQQQAEEITLSLTDLYALDPLESAIADLASYLIDDLSVSAPHVGRQHSATLRFGTAPNPAQDVHMIDLGDFAGHLTQGDSTFAPLAEAIRDGLEQAVVTKIAGPQTTRATGLSIYFPPQEGFYSSSYARITEVAPWNDFLMSYYDMALSGSFAPPQFTNPDRLANYQFLVDGLTVQGTLEAASAFNVTEATLGYGIINEANDTVYLLAEEPASYTNTTVDGFWDYSALTIAQGPNTAYLYMSFDSTQNGDIVLAIPFEYDSPTSSAPQFVTLVYIIDQAGNILQATYYLLTESGPGEFTPQVGSLLYPLVEIIDPNGILGWAYSSANGFDPILDFQLAFVTLPPDTLVYTELVISDFAGNEDYVYFEGIL